MTCPKAECCSFSEYSWSPWKINKTSNRWLVHFSKQLLGDCFHFSDYMKLFLLSDSREDWLRRWWVWLSLLARSLGSSRNQKAELSQIIDRFLKNNFRKKLMNNYYHNFPYKFESMYYLDTMYLSASCSTALIFMEFPYFDNFHHYLSLSS